MGPDSQAGGPGGDGGEAVPDRRASPLGGSDAG